MSRLNAEFVLDHEQRHGGIEPYQSKAEDACAVFPMPNTLNIERRFLTVLIADIVDYSRMIESDDLRTVLELERLRRQVIDPTAMREGADVVRSFGGDGLVLSFDDPLDAIRCARSLQENVCSVQELWASDERISFRIGIAMGSMLSVNGNLHGSALNVAARLQTLAGPEDIWAADSVFNQVHGRIDIPFTAMGVVQLKNITQRVAAYRVDYRSR